MPERIPEYLKNILHDSYRNILDYPGSIAIKKFSHTSKIIRRINDDDLTRISELYQKCFKPDYFDTLLKYSKLFRNIFYVYEVDGIIVAYVAFYVHIRLEGLHPVLEATGFSGGVDPRFRGRGIFSLIYAEGLKELRNNTIQSVHACIRRDNTGSLDAHRKLGFEIVEENGKACGQDFYKLILKYQAGAPGKKILSSPIGNER
jgi:L-amino acid N-acyltransferase YncA